MKKIILLLCLFATFGVSAQQEIYSRARVKLSPEKSVFQLARLGFDITHGDYAPAKHFISEFSASELRVIRAAGFEAEVLIPDLKEHFLEQNAAGVTAEARDDEECYGDSPSPYDQYETPENYTYGSMNGYHTYTEMLAVLDQMRALYPDLISARTPIPDALTHEGNEIYYLRLSDNPDTDEDSEPEVLYTALHHAREPNSAAQMIFFLWYMLENYETDPEVQNLINNTEMYFIPVINVDGYLYNEETDPEGGGFWRKNRRLNDDGSYGVDLNRNYGYEWGFDNTGSSPNPESQVYRGTEPFSEPETTAIKNFCEDHQFQICLNYHTYGNLLIYPWGFSDSVTEEDETFQAISAEMTAQNNFVRGTGTETVGYTVNGVSDDWMYGEQTTKPKIYSMTPEVGPNVTGFWPTQAQIDPYNKSCMYMNLATANLVLNYGRVEEVSPALLTETDNVLEFNVTRLGFEDGDLTVSLTPVSGNVTVNDASQLFTLSQNESASGSFAYTLNEDIESGDEIVFTLGINNGIFTQETTVTKTYFVAAEAFADSADNLDNWGTQTWAATTQEFYSAPSSITDSPTGNYENNSQTFLTLNEEIDLGDAQTAFLQFWAKWDIENAYDYAQISISVNDGQYIPMCGEYTDTGVFTQDEAEGFPLYDGIQSTWVQEKIDMSEYLSEGNNSIRLRFSLFADGGVRADGFFFDDLEILVPGTVSGTVTLGKEDFTYTTAPNPAQTYTELSFSRTLTDAQLRVADTAGKEIMSTQISGNSYRLDTSKFADGVYFYELTIEGETLPAEKFTVLR